MTDETREKVRLGFSGCLEPIILFVTVATAGLGVQQLVGLPPVMTPASLTLYFLEADINQGGDQAGAYKYAVRDTLERIEAVARKEGNNRSSGPIGRRLGSLLQVRISEESEYIASILYPEVSALGLYLEWAYGIRTSQDLLPYFEREPDKDQLALEKIVNDWERSHLIDKLLQDLVLMIEPLLFALLFWVIHSKSIHIGAAIGTSFYLYTAMTLAHDVTYIVAGSVVLLIVAKFLAFIAFIIVFEVWLLEIVPEIFSLPPKQIITVGNIIIVFLAILGHFVI